MYEYKMIQLPQTFQLEKDTGTEIAARLQSILNQHAAEGWEFYRIDQVGSAVPPGCLASFSGAKTAMHYYNILTLRRPTQS